MTRARMLPDDAVMLRLAAIRTHIFGFLADRVLQVAEVVAAGGDEKPIASQLGAEIVQESLRELQRLHEHFAGAKRVDSHILELQTTALGGSQRACVQHPRLRVGRSHPTLPVACCAY